MDKTALFNLRPRLICPASREPFSWASEQQGLSEAGSTAQWTDEAWKIRTRDCPDIPETPEYTSSNPYHTDCLDLIDACRDGIVLNWGAGSPRFTFDNVLETEIRKYPSTDVICTADRLPFADATFDGVISLSVLEHVKDPFEHAAEINRVLKPGGRLVLHAAFLQPFHGAPHHYFNMTQSAYEVLLDRFSIDSLKVGTHQHPWIMLRWVLDRYAAGLESDADRETFRDLSIGDLLDHLSAIEGERAAIKLLDSPRAIAEALGSFNDSNRDRLGSLLRLSPPSQSELAAGFCATATKPAKS